MALSNIYDRTFCENSLRPKAGRILSTSLSSMLCFNPVVPNTPFLYPLKISGNLTVFLCFQGVENGCIGNEWVNYRSLTHRRIQNPFKQLRWIVLRKKLIAKSCLFLQNFLS